MCSLRCCFVVWTFEHKEHSTILVSILIIRWCFCVSISDKLNFLRFWAGICATRGFPLVVWRFADCKYGAIHPRPARFYRPHSLLRKADKCALLMVNELAKGFCLLSLHAPKHKTQGETRTILKLFLQKPHTIFHCLPQWAQLFKALFANFSALCAATAPLNYHFHKPLSERSACTQVCQSVCC